MVTEVGNETLHQESLVNGYLTIPQKPGGRPEAYPILYRLSDNYFR